MTKQRLLMTSVIGGVLAALIVLVAIYLIRGGFTWDGVVSALVIGLVDAFAAFLLFRGRLGKTSC